MLHTLTPHNIGTFPRVENVCFLAFGEKLLHNQVSFHKRKLSAVWEMRFRWSFNCRETWCW